MICIYIYAVFNITRQCGACLFHQPEYWILSNKDRSMHDHKVIRSHVLSPLYIEAYRHIRAELDIRSVRILSKLWYFFTLKIKIVFHTWLVRDSAKLHPHLFISAPAAHRIHRHRRSWHRQSPITGLHSLPVQATVSAAESESKDAPTQPIFSRFLSTGALPSPSLYICTSIL